MSLFEIVDQHFDGEVKVIEPTTFSDNRGSLTVTRLQNDPLCCFPSGFIPRQMVSRSERGVIRGLHYQLDPPMGKLMQVINGAAYLVAVDIRLDSPTFLRYHNVIATDRNNFQVWAPAGFARGYCALEPNTIVLYNCDEYVGEDQAVLWNDPDIGIDWPEMNIAPILSERDKFARTARESWVGPNGMFMRGL
jgi:dTDP-4-dehydrorhamnose 3,5-epimerase